MQDPLPTDGAGTLLVCIMADNQAEDLVRYGRDFSVARGLPWRVVYLETIAARYAGENVRQCLSNALKLAAESQAEMLRLSLEIDSASRIVSTIVQQARSMRASHVLLGQQSLGRRPWFSLGERLSDSAELLVANLPNARIHILASAGSKPVAPAESEPGRPERPPGAWMGTLGTILGALAICSGVCALIAPHLHPINLILIYMVGVFYVALKRDFKAALLTVLFSVVLFDLLFVPPRWSIKPTDPEYFFTFVIAFCVGLAVSRLALRERQTTQRAMLMAQHSQSLSLLSQSLARATTLDEIARAVTTTVERDLGGRVQLMLLDETGQLPMEDPVLHAAARDVLQDIPAPAGLQGFALTVRGMPVGVLLVRDLLRLRHGSGELHLLQGYANQTSVAIERWLFAQASEQAAIAAETERVRNTLLASISHDFRTPLTAIIGAASAALSQGHAITPEQRDTLARTVLDQATRLQSLTSDLLDLARLQEGKVRLQPEWCPAEDLIQDAMATIAPALERHVVVPELQADDFVWCDATLTVQALSNLLLNAAQHSPKEGLIHVGIALEPDQCRLTVRDEGPGLPPGAEREVFKKFYHEPSATGQHRGTGLGLAICEVVARLHGGHIEARNAGGAVFVMTLPQPGARPQLEETLDD